MMATLVLQSGFAFCYFFFHFLSTAVYIISRSFSFLMFYMVYVCCVCNFSKRKRKKKNVWTNEKTQNKNCISVHFCVYCILVLPSSLVSLAGQVHCCLLYRWHGWISFDDFKRCKESSSLSCSQFFFFFIRCYANLLFCTYTCVCLSVFAGYLTTTTKNWSKDNG